MNVKYEIFLANELKSNMSKNALRMLAGADPGGASGARAPPWP